MGSTPSTTASSPTVGGSSSGNNNNSTTSSVPKRGGLVGARIRSHKEASTHITTNTHQPHPRPPTTSNTTKAPSSPKSPKATKSHYEHTTTATMGSGTPPSVTTSRPQSMSVDEAAMSFNGSLPSGIHSSPYSCPPSVSSSATAGIAHIVLPVPRPLDNGTSFNPHQQHRQQRMSSTTTTTSKGGLSLSTSSSKRIPCIKVQPSPVMGTTSTSAGSSCPTT